MSKGATPIYFQFEGHPEIIQSHNWRLEMDVNLHRNRLGLPFWTRYKTIPYDDVDPNPEQDLTIATLSRHDGHTSDSASVSTPPKKHRSRGKKATSVPDVSHILSDFLGAGNLPESHPAGSEYTIPPSLDKRNDVEETK